MSIMAQGMMSLIKKNSPSQPSISDSDSERTKANDLLAFRTIMTMLRCLNSPKRTQEKFTVTVQESDDRKILKVLDALSTLLVREHEITAVVAKSFDGLNIPIIATVVDPTDETSPQSDANSNIWSWFRDFTVSINPRVSKVNNNIDSLMNNTSLPIIGDYEDKVPDDLRKAAGVSGRSGANVALLDAYLANHWCRETFETHAWMLKTLIGGSAASEEDENALCNYITAASFKKMRSRMTKITSYYDCLRNQTTDSLSRTIPLQGELGVSQADEPLISMISFLSTSADIKIPNLKRRVELKQQIYDKSTYIELHYLLRELLTRFKGSLDLLHSKSTRGARSPNDVDDVKKILGTVWTFGRWLKKLARSSAIETHFKTITPVLDVDEGKSWTPESDDPDFSDFQSLKPYSMRKGKILLPWESYRDWLLLMVRYYDAASVLTNHMSKTHGDAISITILSPPNPDKKLLTWTQLLGNTRYFPSQEDRKFSGEDLITFLTALNYSPDSSHAHFLSSLKQGPLQSGSGYSGAYHAEAYIASLLSFGAKSDGLDMLNSESRIKIKELLVKIKDCQHAIGVSKRCCPVCANLLYQLNNSIDSKSKFVVSDEHSNITACALPEWLPGGIVYSMVVEFSRRLRDELEILRNDISNGSSRNPGHKRTNTNDTGRMSMGSNTSEDVPASYAVEAMAISQQASSGF